MKTNISIIGVRNISGTSAKNNKAYSFCKATAIEPAQSRAGKVSIVACGFDVREYELSEQAFNFLKSQHFPIDLEANLEMDRENKLRIETVQPVRKPSAA